MSLVLSSFVNRAYFTDSEGVSLQNKIDTLMIQFKNDLKSIEFLKYKQHEQTK